jgi:hypothetical protein
MKCSGIYAPCLWNPYNQKWGKNIIKQSIHGILDCASLLAGSSTLVHFVGSPYMITPTRRLDTNETIKIYRELSDSILFAKQAIAEISPSLQFSYHLYDYDLICGPNILSSFAGQTGIGLTLDNYFLHSAIIALRSTALTAAEQSGNTLRDLETQTINALSQHINVIHLNDFAYLPYCPYQAPHRPLGQGNAHLATFLRRVAEACTSVKFVVIEHEVGQNDGISWISKSLTYYTENLQHLFNKAP